MGIVIGTEADIEVGAETGRILGVGMGIALGLEMETSVGAGAGSAVGVGMGIDEC